MTPTRELSIRHPFVMHSFLLIVALVTAASAAPFVIPSLDRLDEKTITRGLASDEAQTLASTEFTLVASSAPGCATNVSHAEVNDVPEGESPDLEGIITFANISINGETCGTGQEGEIMMLYSQDVLDVTLPGGKVLNLSFEAARSIIVGGADSAVRSCGSWVEEYEQSYAFSMDIKRLLPSLSENGFIDNSTISNEILTDDSIWMVSAPQDAPGRVCLYRQAVDRDELNVVPTTTPGPDGIETDGGTSDPDRDTSTEDGESSGEGTGASEDSDDEQGSTFGDANAEALELEEQDAAEERSCFPGSAQVHLEDGTVKTMAELAIGDRVMVAPNVFSEVFMFTHKLEGGDYKFIRIVTDSGKALSATAGHFVYVNGRPITAENVSVGDFVELADGTKTAVISVSSVYDRGLYNPQTQHGDVMVNDIRASTYTSAVNPFIAHALLTPFRVLFSQLSFQIASFDGGADSLVRIIRKGQALY